MHRFAEGTTAVTLDALADAKRRFKEERRVVQMWMKGRKGVVRKGFDRFAPGFENVGNVRLVKDFVARDAQVKGREGALEHRSVNVVGERLAAANARALRRKAGRARLTVGDAVQNPHEPALRAEKRKKVAAEKAQLFRTKEFRILFAPYGVQGVAHVGERPLAASALRFEPLEGVGDERHDALVRAERPGDVGDGFSLSGPLPDGRAQSRGFFGHRTSSAGCPACTSVRTRSRKRSDSPASAGRS